MSYLDILRSRLVADEGRRNLAYPDTKGKITIGIGHNLSDKPISDAAVDQIFRDDISDAEHDARALVPNFDALSDVRKAVVAEMSFQLGYLRLSQFKNTLAAIVEERWGDAADGMLDSEVARTQAPERWQRMAQMMRSDTDG